MIKVGFLPLYNIGGPSSRYRVFQFIAPLSRQGFKCTLLDAPEGNNLKRFRYLPRLFAMARNCDVLYIQKRTFPSWVLRTLHRLNPHIVFDLDDAIFLQLDNTNKVNQILKLSRAVVAGNEYLAAYARKYNHHVHVIPTVVDTNNYRQPPNVRHPDDQRIVIGWIGTDPNRGDFEHMKSVLDWLGQQYNERVLLRTVCREPLDLKTCLPVEFVRWTLAESLQALQTFDLGIMPLLDTEWNRGKCGLKLIEYMSVGAPPVASPIGVNQEIIQDGKIGFLAHNQADWQKYLTRLIEDKTLRVKLGQLGTKRVKEDYSITAVLPNLIDLLQWAAVKKSTQA